MKLANARLTFNGYETCLSIEIDGVPVDLMASQGSYHEPFMRARLVALPVNELADKQPVRIVPMPGRNESAQRVRGMSDDPRLFALYEGLVKWRGGAWDAPAWLLDEPIAIPPDPAE